MCEEHWAKLREGVQERGLWPLVSSSGEEAAQRMLDELDGEAATAGHDPLMSAHWAICGKALEQGGLYLMTEKDDGGEYCPLCEVEKHTQAGMAQNWIDGCLDAQRRFCIDSGLITDNTQ